MSQMTIAVVLVCLAVAALGLTLVPPVRRNEGTIELRIMLLGWVIVAVYLAWTDVGRPCGDPHAGFCGHPPARVCEE